jgi:hypothetical protein
MGLQAQLREQQAANDAARERNARAGGRGQRPEGRPGDGRGEGPRRAGHGAARRDPGAGHEEVGGRTAARGAGLAALAAASLFTLLGSPVTGLELLAFVLSLWMVLCNLRVHPLAWPLAMASSLLYGVLFADSRLYGEATLQLLFIAVAAVGLVAMAARHRDDGRRAAVHG